MSHEERHGMLQVSTRSPAPACVPAVPAAHNSTTASPRRESHRRTGIALIDEFPLRRASTLNLLRTHVRMGLRPFGSVDEFLTQAPASAEESCCVVVCVGGRSVAEAPMPEQLRRLTHALASTPVIVLSDREEAEEVVAAFGEGVRGYIPTHLEPCLAIEALRIVLAGGTYFPAELLIRSRRKAAPATERRPDPEQIAGEQRDHWPPRQFAVLRLLVQGKANKEIARALTMEESTVKVHVRHIMRKLGVTNRTQAALYARRLGIPPTLDGGLASIVAGPGFASASAPSA
jgi:DNA-binding NarL/FixJ family response regulator